MNCAPAAALAAGLWLVSTAAVGAAPPVIAVVIDDLGNSFADGKRVAALPGPVACAILPHTQHARQIADLAYANKKEVLLHLPMQAEGDLPQSPGTVTLDMTEQEIKDTVAAAIAAVPHVVGVNNHEGSLITRHPGDMAWIMQALHQAGPLFYLDSFTDADSVAYQVAREQGVPAARRNVFLDDVATDEAVREQWRRLLALARKHGFALAIGHPKGVTLRVLEDVLSRLDEEKVVLVPVGRIVELQAAYPMAWPASNSAPSAADAHLRNRS